MKKPASKQLSSNHKRLKPHKFKKSKDPSILLKLTKRVGKPKGVFKFPNIPRLITDGIRSLTKDSTAFLKEIQLFFSTLVVEIYRDIKKNSSKPIGAVVMMGLLTTIFLIPVILVGSDVSKLLIEREKVLQKRSTIVKEKEYWQKIAKKHSDYRDAYFKLALLDYQLKNYEGSWYYLGKTLQLDPNFEPARKLETLLNK